MTHRNLITDVVEQCDVEPPFIRLVVAQTDGSTPREIGASMVVSEDRTIGTIGGGQLEFEAITHARMLLKQEPEARWLRDLHLWPLGPSLGQCCGGAVRVLFERYGAHEIGALSAIKLHANSSAVVIHPSASGKPLLVCSSRQEARDLPFPIAGSVSDILSGAQASEPRLTQPQHGIAYFIEPITAPPVPLFIYGAGHVGQAIVKIASDLAFDVHWVDTHQERFPEQQSKHVHHIVAREPARIAAAAPAGAFHLILTYSHAIDLAICHTLLANPTFSFLGLIGSQTKRARFLKRLRDGGISEAALSRLTCPIGIGALRGKEPSTIAVAVAAQLIEQLERMSETSKRSNGEMHDATQQLRA